MHAPGALGPDDAEEVADDLPPNSSALLIAFENSWAAKFVDACRAADAVLIDQIRIPADVVEAALSGEREPRLHELRGTDMGLLRMATRTAVVAGTATAVSGRVARRQAAKYDQQAAQQYAEPPPPAAPAASEQDEQISKLQDLAQLNKQGVLSDEEFAAAKAKILGI